MTDIVEQLRSENFILKTAIFSVISATQAYLPPDGIDAKECINRVLEATDNANINDIMGYTLTAQQKDEI